MADEEENRNLMGRLSQADIDQRAAEDEADEKRNILVQNRMMAEHEERKAKEAANEQALADEAVVDEEE